MNKFDHLISNIWNIKSIKSKKPLSIVMELIPKANNKEIYEVKSLIHSQVTFESPRPRCDISQCANCQQYGHTKTYCRRKPKCIKCAGDHTSVSYARKVRSDDVKCTLCEGNHPDNYKGCIVYQNLYKTRFPIMRKKQVMITKTQLSHWNYSNLPLLVPKLIMHKRW